MKLKRAQKIHQHGAAILVAMLVVTMVATLAAGLQWRQWRMLEQESAAQAHSQAVWVLVGALDWARLILREDARAAGNGAVTDHLGEPWALPLQESKLSSFLAADALSEPRQDEAYLSGSIHDAQSKINVTNLLTSQAGTAGVSAQVMDALGRLYQQLNLPPAELTAWTSAWIASQASPAQPPAVQTNTDKPLRPSHLEQLVWFGLSSHSLDALKNYLVILPQRTPVNLNTASAIVIYAIVPNIDMAAAQKLVQARAQTPLQNVSDANQYLGLSRALAVTDYSVSTQYFEVRGRLRLGDWVVEESSLVQREGLNVRTVWRKRI